MELHPFLELDVNPNPNLWYVLSISGECPSMRVGHSATYVPAAHSDEHDRVFIIGGANPSQVFCEVYVLDLVTRSWDCLEAAGFRGRYEHAAFRVENHPGKIFIFGGATQAGNLNDLQSLDTSSGTWSDVDMNGAPPSPRTHRSCATVGSKVYFYSGGHCGPDPVGDRRVHCLDTESMTWSCLTPRGDPPKPRHGHVMVAHGNRIYLHGGMAGSAFYDDLHILDLDHNSWSAIKKKKACPARAAHDALSHEGSVVLFGGMNKTGALHDVYKIDTGNNVWSPVEPEGPPPANRLDFAMCAIRLQVPVQNSSSQQEVLEDLTDTSAKAREVLERELKPGSASSRDSVSDSGSVDEALYTLDSEHTQALKASSEAGAAGEEQDKEGDAAETQEVQMVLINGGMDTEGEIFDDTLVLLL